MKLIRKLIAGLIGFPLLIIGIILIPVPGPGLLTCFVALFILSFGFDWAHRYLEKSKAMLHKLFNDARKRADKIEKK